MNNTNNLTNINNFTDIEKRKFINAFETKNTKYKDDVVPSDVMLQTVAKKNYQAILNPKNAEDDKYLYMADLNSLIDGVQENWPKKYSNRTIDQVPILITNKINMPFVRKTLGSDDIEKVRAGLYKKINEREGNKKLAALCRRALENPYLLDISVFENWMDLLIKNFDSDIFADLSNIFVTINNEKNIPEKVVNKIFKKSKNGTKDNADKNEIKLRNRKQYYQSGERKLKTIIALLPENYDITTSLPSLNNFIKVLEESKLPDVENQIEYFLLELFTPGRIRFSTENDLTSQNTISNIYDLCINYFTKPEVKKQFIEHMFNHENCSVLAITKGKELLADNTTKYTPEIKLYVVQKLSELYLNRQNLDDAYVLSIKKCILEYVCKGNNFIIQKNAFYTFFDSVKKDEQNDVIGDLLYISQNEIRNNGNEILKLLWDMCYEDKLQYAALPDKCRDILKEFQIRVILESDDYTEKNSTFKSFTDIIRNSTPEDLEHVFEDILNQDSNNTCDISALHEAILKEYSLPEKMKLNSIKIMCNGYKKANDSVKGNIKSLMSDILIMEDNEQIKTVVASTFYRDTLSHDEQNDFLTFIYNKCNQNGDKFRLLPKSISDDILQANSKTINPDAKNQMMIKLFESFEKEKDSSLENDIINYLLSDSNPADGRKVLLMKILDSVHKV